MIRNLDLAIMTFMTGFAGKSALFDHAINTLSQLDLFKGIVLMGLFWFTWAYVKPNQTARERDERHEKLVNILIISLLIGGLSRGLQLGLHVHKRPLLSDLHLPFPVLEAGTDGLNGWNSFPSDHSMLFFALSTGLWTINRRAGLVAFIWSAVVIDFPRVYLGIHYPSDVVAGAILGIGCMLGFQRVRLTRLDNAMSAWRNAHTGVFMAVMFLITDELAHLLGEFRELARAVAIVLFHT